MCKKISIWDGSARRAASPARRDAVEFALQTQQKAKQFSSTYAGPGQRRQLITSTYIEEIDREKKHALLFSPLREAKIMGVSPISIDTIRKFVKTEARKKELLESTVFIQRQIRFFKKIKVYDKFATKIHQRDIALMSMIFRGMLHRVLEVRFRARCLSRIAFDALNNTVRFNANQIVMAFQADEQYKRLLLHRMLRLYKKRKSMRAKARAFYVYKARPCLGNILNLMQIKQANASMFRMFIRDEAAVDGGESAINLQSLICCPVKPMSYANDYINTLKRRCNATDRLRVRIGIESLVRLAFQMWQMSFERASIEKAQVKMQQMQLLGFYFDRWQEDSRGRHIKMAYCFKKWKLFARRARKEERRLMLMDRVRARTMQQMAFQKLQLNRRNQIIIRELGSALISASPWARFFLHALQLMIDNQSKYFDGAFSHEIDPASDGDTLQLAQVKDPFGHASVGAVLCFKFIQRLKKKRFMRIAFQRVVLYNHALINEARLRFALSMWRTNIQREKEMTGQEKYLLSLQQRDQYESDICTYLAEYRTQSSYKEKLFGLAQTGSSSLQWRAMFLELSSFMQKYSGLINSITLSQIDRLLQRFPQIFDQELWILLLSRVASTVRKKETRQAFDNREAKIARFKNLLNKCSPQDVIAIFQRIGSQYPGDIFKVQQHAQGVRQFSFRLQRDIVPKPPSQVPKNNNIAPFIHLLLQSAPAQRQSAANLVFNTFRMIVKQFEQRINLRADETTAQIPLTPLEKSHLAQALRQNKLKCSNAEFLQLDTLYAHIKAIRQIGDFTRYVDDTVHIVSSYITNPEFQLDLNYKQNQITILFAPTLAEIVCADEKLLVERWTVFQPTAADYVRPTPKRQQEQTSSIDIHQIRVAIKQKKIKKLVPESIDFSGLTDELNQSNAAGMQALQATQKPRLSIMASKLSSSRTHLSNVENSQLSQTTLLELFVQDQENDGINANITAIDAHALPEVVLVKPKKTDKKQDKKKPANANGGKAMRRQNVQREDTVELVAASPKPKKIDRSRQPTNTPITNEQLNESAESLVTTTRQPVVDRSQKMHSSVLSRTPTPAGHSAQITTSTDAIPPTTQSVEAQKLNSVKNSSQLHNNELAGSDALRLEKNDQKAGPRSMVPSTLAQPQKTVQEKQSDALRQEIYRVVKAQSVASKPLPGATAEPAHGEKSFEPLLSISESVAQVNSAVEEHTEQKNGEMEAEKPKKTARVVKIIKKKKKATKLSPGYDGDVAEVTGELPEAIHEAQPVEQQQKHQGPPHGKTEVETLRSAQPIRAKAVGRQPTEHDVVTTAKQNPINVGAQTSSPKESQTDAKVEKLDIKRAAEIEPHVADKKSARLSSEVKQNPPAKIADEKQQLEVADTATRQQAPLKAEQLVQREEQSSQYEYEEAYEEQIIEDSSEIEQDEQPPEQRTNASRSEHQRTEEQIHEQLIEAYLQNSSRRSLRPNSGVSNMTPSQLLLQQMNEAETVCRDRLALFKLNPSVTLTSARNGSPQSNTETPVQEEIREQSPPSPQIQIVSKKQAIRIQKQSEPMPSLPSLGNAIKKTASTLSVTHTLQQNQTIKKIQSQKSLKPKTRAASKPAEGLSFFITAQAPKKADTTEQESESDFTQLSDSNSNGLILKELQDEISSSDSQEVEARVVESRSADQKQMQHHTTEKELNPAIKGNTQSAARLAGKETPVGDATREQWIKMNTNFVEVIKKYSGLDIPPIMYKEAGFIFDQMAEFACNREATIDQMRELKPLPFQLYEMMQLINSGQHYATVEMGLAKMLQDVLLDPVFKSGFPPAACSEALMATFSQQLATFLTSDQLLNLQRIPYELLGKKIAQELPNFLELKKQQASAQNTQRLILNPSSLVRPKKQRSIPEILKPIAPPVNNRNAVVHFMTQKKTFPRAVEAVSESKEQPTAEQLTAIQHVLQRVSQERSQVVQPQSGFGRYFQRVKKLTAREIRPMTPLHEIVKYSGSKPQINTDFVRARIEQYLAAAHKNISRNANNRAQLVQRLVLETSLLSQLDAAPQIKEEVLIRRLEDIINNSASAVSLAPLVITIQRKPPVEYKPAGGRHPQLSPLIQPLRFRGSKLRSPSPERRFHPAQRVELFKVDLQLTVFSPATTQMSKSTLRAPWQARLSAAATQ